MRNHWLAVATLAALMSAGAPSASARADDTKAESAGAASTVKGTIAEVRPSDGVMTLCRPGGGSVELHGMPQQLQGFTKGSQVAVPYQTYGSTWWLKAPEGFGGSGAGGTGEQPAAGKSFKGKVQSVDVNQGRATIDGQEFRAHPSQIAQLSAGDSVMASCQSFQGKAWLRSVQVCARKGAGGSGTSPETGPGVGGSGSRGGGGGLR